MSRQGRKAGAVFKKIAYTAVISLFVAVALVAPSDLSLISSANAADMTKFNAGEIISDNNFYTHGVMSVAQIQTFLNTQGADCEKNGSIVCMKDFTLKTVAYPSEAGLCSAIAGGKTMTAAQYISTVSAACNISERVILVILQKEQGSITTTKPTDWMYRAAMGYACPDDGTCDKAESGFVHQVYKGARAFKVYKLYPDYYNWFKVGTNNNIQYSPEASCGTKKVLIKNSATAGLYFYTPFTPNAAALKTSHGLGDACSAYGNRNFYSYFAEWFGNPVGKVFAVTGEIKDRWEQMGAEASYLGWPTANQTCDARGCGQPFTGGAIFHVDALGKTFVNSGIIRKKYLEIGGRDNYIGYPTSDIACTTQLCEQSYDGGIIFYMKSDNLVFVNTESLPKISTKKPFKDLGGLVAVRKTAINWLFQHGVTIGSNPEGTKYSPKNPVNRGAMADFLFKFALQQKTTLAVPKITDISKLTVSRQHSIKWLASTKITLPTANKYQPANPVNRGAMAEFMYKLAGAPGALDTNPNSKNNHVDPKTVTQQEKQYKNDKKLMALKKTNPNRYYDILWLAKNGITKGVKKDGKLYYNPSDAVNRGAMAEFLQRLYEVIQKFPKPAPSPTPKPVPSSSPSPSIAPTPSFSPTTTPSPEPTESTTPESE